MIKRSVAIFLALWVGLVLPGEAFAYRIQADAMTEKCGKPAHCPHCSTTDKCPKACVLLCAIGMTLSFAANAQPPFNIPAAHLPWTFVPPDTSPPHTAHLPWTFVPPDTSPPHTSRLLRPPIG